MPTNTSGAPVCATFDTPLGPMLLAATPRGLAGAWFDGQRHWPDASGWREEPAHAVLREAATQLCAYFAGRRETFDVPLDPLGGTAFQRSVWDALPAIPRGKTATYSGLAARLGHAQAARAIGAAVGRNPLSVIVPCHRVVGSDGSLTGYAGGLDRKTALLRLEGALSH